MSRTSQEWWDEVKNNPVKFDEWLIKQYRGEVTAAARIREFALDHAPAKHIEILNIIADQEEQHASWIAELLLDRCIPVPDVQRETAENRYWKETLPEIEDFQTGAAVAAHAELMRLERIKTIANDWETPAFIREVFHRIWVDEEFHEAAFREMAGDEAYTRTSGAHQKGLEALGLVV